MEGGEGDALGSAHVDDQASTPLGVIAPNVIQDGALRMLAVDTASLDLCRERMGGGGAHGQKSTARVKG